MNHYDVIIIGAGPAGASCAKKLVKNGVKTLIIEKKKLPRIKCCSGLLNKEAVNFIHDNFGTIPRKIVCKNENITINFSKTGREFFKFPGNMVFKNVYRDQLDHWLVEESKSDILDEHNMIHLTQKENMIELICENNQKKYTFFCDYLVGADGAFSTVKRKLIGNHFDSNIGVAVQYVFKGKFDLYNDFYNICFSKRFSNNAFSFFNIKNDFLYIGTGWFEKNNNYLKRWIDHLKERFSISLENPIQKQAAFVENNNTLYLGKNNILLAGESGGLIEKYFIGITSALQSGFIAAETILKHHRPDIAEFYIQEMSDLVSGIIENWKVE